PDDLRIYAKVAELKEKTGDTHGAVADYDKIAHAYADEGYVVQAIAVSKLILRIDPTQTAIQESLKALSEERGGSGDDFAFTSATGESAPSADKVRAGLASTPLMSGMSGEQLESFIDSLQLRNVDAGEQIYRTGEPGEHLYLIAMGKVSLQATDMQGRKQVFSQLKEGDFFGERSFMSRIDHKDEAIAESECSILMVDRSTFDGWVEQHPEMRKTVEDFYRQRVLKRLLAITPVFEAVPKDARMVLVEKFTLRTFEDGDVIMREGEVGETFYLIRSGIVALMVSGPENKKALQASLSEGDFFGEVALLTGRPRTATIHAKGSVELMELSRSDFDLITQEYPSVREVVQNYMRKRAKETIDALRNQTTQP
ncbi:MAG: cyclic nucleotide-binding domain-containing protein, partial [Mariprofundaceae bacterium]